MSMLVEPAKKFSKVIGLYIALDATSIETIKTVLHKEADRKTEVIVRVLDNEKEFTLEDFLKRLGFE